MINATSRDMAEISTILISSFEDNKSITHLISDGSGKIKRFNSLIIYCISTCLQFGKVVFSDDRQGCALILFPDKKKFTFIMLWRDLNLAFKLGFSPAIRAMRREKLVKNRHPDEKLYYLWYIGVKPDQQGKGTGSSLVRELILDAQKMNLTLALETSTSRNIPWYQKLGFRIYEELNLGYLLYFMKHQT